MLRSDFMDGLFLITAFTLLVMFVSLLAAYLDERRDGSGEDDVS